MFPNIAGKKLKKHVCEILVVVFSLMLDSNKTGINPLLRVIFLFLQKKQGYETKRFWRYKKDAFR